MKYRYHASYSYQGPNTLPSAFGQVVVDWNKPLEEWNDIQNLTEFIVSRFFSPGTSVVIIAFTLMKVIPEE